MRAGWTISAWFLSLIWSIEHDGLRNVPDGPFLGGGPALVRPACAGARNHRQGRRRLTAPPAPWCRRRRPRWPARPTCFAFSRLASRWNCGVHSAHYSSGQALRGLPYSFLDDEVYVWAALWATRPVTRAALVPLAIAAYLWRRMPPPPRHSPGASSRWPPPPRGWIPATRCWAWGVRGPGTPLLVPDRLAEGAGDGRDVEAEVLGHGAYDLLRGIAGPDGYRCRARYRSL